MKNKYIWVIIEESLWKKSILEWVEIIDTKFEIVTEKHKTPWIKKWTLYTVEINVDKIENISEKISLSLDSKHNWYADFKNNKYHYQLFFIKKFLK